MTYKQLWELFYGEYDLKYCVDRGLFYELKKDGSTIKHITKSLVDYPFEILNTDLSMIFGPEIRYIDENNDTATEKLKVLHEDNNFDELARLAVLQGLILGNTALKVGRDDRQRVRTGLVNFLRGDVDFVMDAGTIIEWKYKYSVPDGNSTVNVEERYRKDRTIIDIGGNIKEAPNAYGEFWFKYAANMPSLNSDVWGDSELERFADTVDEMNSYLSRIGAIADIYAKPRIIARKLMNPESLQATDNLWAIDAEDISILEYQGNVIPSLLATYDRLENYLRNKCPELIMNDLGQIAGYALKLKLSKLIRKIENYRNVYFPFLESVSNLMLKMDGVAEPNVKIRAQPVIPSDEVEDIQKWMQLVSLNLVSKETAAEALGIDWKQEKKRMDKESEEGYARMAEYLTQGSDENEDAESE
jgi:hypothetical protein